MNTIKRITLALSKEDDRQINELIKKFGENRSVIIKKGLNLLYFTEFPYEKFLLHKSQIKLQEKI